MSTPNMNDVTESRSCIVGNVGAPAVTDQVRGSVTDDMSETGHPFV